MYKNIITLALIILAIVSLQGCKESLERAYTLGENIDPDDPLNQKRVGGVMYVKPVIRCSKELAFGYYCLGGSIKTLLEQRKPFRQYAKDGLSILDFRERWGLTTIATFQGKILSAYRTDRPANMQTLAAVRQRIEMRYGSADDKSTFASDIKTSRSMEFAVFNKRAKAHYVWSMPGWRVDVVWDNIRDIQITFLDEDLNEAYLAHWNQPPAKP